MRILFFSTYSYPYFSGLTLYPFRVLKNLAKDNTVTILTFNHSRKLKTEEDIEGMRIKRIGYLFRLSKGFISPTSLIHYIKNVLNTDVLIIALPNFEAFLLAIFAKILGKKIISIYCCEVYLGEGLKNNIISFFLNLSVDVQLSLSDKIIVFPDYIESLSVYSKYRNKIIKSLPIIEQKDTYEKFSNKLKKLKRDNKWIGFVGRVATEKGIETLIEAISKLQNKKIVLVFAGPVKSDTVGEQKYFEKIEQDLKDKKINYIFFGKLSENELGSFYQSIDVLALPSVNKTEAFGMVQAEAMLLGTPVVASDLPGVRVPITLTGMGLLFIPKDAESLKDALGKVIVNIKKYSTDGKRKLAKNHFNADKVIALYNEVINNL